MSISPQVEVEPEVLLLSGLPHVAQLALPRPRVFRCLRAEAPALPDLRAAAGWSHALGGRDGITR
jgi:hypothetical protein